MITLVLLPGMDGSGALFAPLVAALRGRVHTQVIAYPPDQALGYEELVAFVRPLLPTGPYFLLGESFSGPVAIALAASAPPGLAGLILSCTFARNPSPKLKPLRFMLPLMPLSARLSVFAIPLLLGRHATRPLVDALRVALEPLQRDVLLRRLNAVLDVDYSSLVAGIDVPVLYIQARNDRVVACSFGEDLARVLPSMRRVTFTGPHLLLQVASDQVARSVLQFIDCELKRADMP